jgi:Ser-tRNA(Ala) deacylase AlaX
MSICTDTTEAILPHHVDNGNDEQEHDENVVEVAIPPSWPPTDMLYMSYEGSWLTECQSTVLEVVPAYPSTTNDASSHQFSIILDRTVMHAQGGGQPTDVGHIIIQPKKSKNSSAVKGSQNIILHIDKVLIDRTTGVARHYGTTIDVQKDDTCDEMGRNLTNAVTASDVDRRFFDDPNHCMVQVGDSVRVQIDIEQRQILSECHTAGHVVDAAMVRCGCVMKPSKAYHFLDSPYVEYIGTIPEPDRETALLKLQVAFRELIDENIDTKIELLSKDEADDLCNGDSKTFDIDTFTNSFCTEEPPIVRVVSVAGFACPCGGTHVRNTGVLNKNKWGITGFKCKKGVIRVKYGQDVEW